MNKYTARALNQEAALGRRVLVVSGTWRHAADAYAELTAAAYPTVTRTPSNTPNRYTHTAKPGTNDRTRPHHAPHTARHGPPQG